uniref:GDT1 family protein n=1 Tax=Brassica campestris TaxID=3711 RepID=M4DD60_BRACM
METFGAMSSVLQGFTKSFFKIEFSEVGDKTFCVAAILAMRNPRRLVLAGCVSASIVTTILSATLGWAAPDLAFLFTFFAEFGDKSLRTTIRLAADENPFGVVLGGVVFLSRAEDDDEERH